MVWRIIVVVLSYILFWAHLSRHHLDPWSYLVLFIPLLFLVKHRWALRVMEYVLYLATVSWIYTTVQIAMERVHSGEPYIRFLIIMIAVIIYTVFSALVLRSRVWEPRYK